MRSYLLSRWYLAAALGLAIWTAGNAAAQFQGPNNVAAPNGQANQNVNAAPFPGPGVPGGQGNALFGPGAFGNGNGNGAAQNADFDSLIDLIVSTVATDTWNDNGGGAADIRPFPNGVMVDTAG